MWYSFSICKGVKDKDMDGEKLKKEIVLFYLVTFSLKRKKTTELIDKN